MTFSFRTPLRGKANAGISPSAITADGPSRSARLTLLLAILTGVYLSAFAQPSAARGRPAQQQTHKLVVKVVDETGVAVASARVVLVRAETQTAVSSNTDDAGRHEFNALTPGAYQLRVEKEDFYGAIINDVRVGQTESLEVTLYHQQEIAETVNVYDSPRAIDPARTEVKEDLTNREIINLPYPSTRDVRAALPLIPGVLPDPAAAGQVHVDGSATYEIFDQLDGFNITHPVSGALDLRVSTDALRAIEVRSSRYSAQYGKGSGGVLSLTTGMGDDRYRFSATNFIPSLQNRRGLNVNEWTPRATLSGPLRKKKAWFYEAADGEYGLKIIDELPRGADKNPAWRVGDLAKAQVNLNQKNILTASFLINHFHSEHAGLSRFSPLETTLDTTQSAYLFSVKEQSYLARGALLEIGAGINQYRTDERPFADLSPYVISPEGTSGNFFRTGEGRARRLQGVADLILPTAHWRGQHEFKLGLDVDRITDDQSLERRPIFILREAGTLARQINFTPTARFSRANFEASGYAQDRWSVSERWLLEYGVRFDRDEIIRRTSVSPRLASTYLLTRAGNTKISAGAGLYTDATNLDFITRPLAGRRFDLFYAPDGKTLAGPPLETSFRVDERSLRVPRSLNWSVGLEQKLPAEVYLEAEFVQKRGHDGFTFINLGAGQAGQPSGLFELTNLRRDRYDGLQVTLRRSFKGGHAVLASYARSRARSNAVLDFDVDNPLFSQQAGGPLPWDAPNRFLSWGFLPLAKRFDFAYSLDWRSGYPFSLVNQGQQLVGAPDALRFPTYFTLDTHVERRFRLLGCRLALRAGFNDVTDRKNPSAVNNNVDSPQFLTFGGTQHRTFTGRIRFLGRK